MINLIKNDLLTLSKQRSTLIELLFMPLLVTLILGFSLEALFDDTGLPEIKVGVLNEQSEDEGLNALAESLEAENYSEEEIDQLLSQANELNPTEMLTDILEEEGLNELLTLQPIDNQEAGESAIENEDIVGYIVFTEDFNESFYRSVFLDDAVSAELSLVVRNEENLYESIIVSIMDQLVAGFNLETSVMTATQGQLDAPSQSNDYGEVAHLSVEDPVSAFQYYTIGMGVMFCLFTSVTIAIKAFTEKQDYIYDRILLTSTSPATYLFSKLFSTLFIVLGQLSILFLISQLVFSTFSSGLDLWLNLFAMSLIYAFVVGAITSLLTSITLYANDTTTANFFSSLVAIFSLLGGSYFPIEQFSQLLARIGEWTPNGAAMLGYLQLIQGFQLNEILNIVIRLLSISAVCIVLAIAIFPQRRSV